MVPRTSQPCYSRYLSSWQCIDTVRRKQMLITNKACIPDPLIRILQERGQSAEPRSLCLSCWSIICNAISKYKRNFPSPSNCMSLCSVTGFSRSRFKTTAVQLSISTRVWTIWRERFSRSLFIVPCIPIDSDNTTMPRFNRWQETTYLIRKFTSRVPHDKLAAAASIARSHSSSASPSANSWRQNQAKQCLGYMTILL